MTTVKFISIVLLTIIPFLLSWLLNAGGKKKESGNKNLISTVSRYFPYFKKVGKRAYLLIVLFYDKMKGYVKARKLFTLLLFLSMIALQFIDNTTSQSRVRYYLENASVNAEAFSHLPHNIKIAILERMAKDPFVVTADIYLIAVLVTFLFFSYRISDKALTKIHNSRKIFALLLVCIAFFLFWKNGKALLLSEISFLLLLAGTIYPNFEGEEDPKKKQPIHSEEKKRSRCFHRVFRKSA